MTTTSWFLVALATVLGLGDWWAVWTEQPSIRRVTKPGTLVALIGVAVTLQPVDPTIRTWMVIGLAFSLAGDVFLLLEERWFVAGLASFLVGHIAYVVGLLHAPIEWAGVAAGVAVVVVSIATVGRRIVTAVSAGDHRHMVAPVIAYLLVISAMVVAAFATAAPWALGGALLFYVSDATLAWNRFLARRRLGPSAVMVTYHLAQAGLVGWVLVG